MALALRFPEEGDFSSRACELPFEGEDNLQAKAPGAAIFRWSKEAREQSPGLASADAKASVTTLVVAMPGAAQAFARGLTAGWHVVGSLITSDQPIQPFRLGEAGRTATTILSKTTRVGGGADDALVVIMTQQVPLQSTWAWLNALRSRIDAKQTFCLDSQISTIYEDVFAGPSEPFPLLRVLSTAAAAVEDATGLALPLPTPQFTTGVPAALLTLGELRKQSVSVFISLRDVATAPGDVVRSFLPLATLLKWELPPAFKSTAAVTTSVAPEVSVLYT